MWSKNGTPVPTSTTPIPSRSSSTMICGLVVVAVRPGHPGHETEHLHPVAARNARHLVFVVPTVTPQPARRPDFADQHAAVEQPLPDRATRSANTPNSTKFASESATESPWRRSQATAASRSVAQFGHAWPAARRRAPTPPGPPPGSPPTGDTAAAREAARRPRPVRRPGSRAAAGECERLAHRPGDHQPGCVAGGLVRSARLHRANSPYASSTTTMPGAAAHDALDQIRIGSGGTGRVVR